MKLFDSLLVALPLITDGDDVLIEGSSNWSVGRLLVESLLDFGITLGLTKS